ncbi:tyrosine-type recombinase/integrase [Kocuria tytonicola]|uniref:tyrosine-type recombinase/integrase n=1 Tax=Kocuria tytonicola TaxID=2055946 RepID=UPI001F0CBCC7|nr:site-specific integrase [Kocuria tytonicola]
MPTKNYTGSIKQRTNGAWRARYRDEDRREHARHFKLKRDAEAWLQEVTASLVRGDYLDPQQAAMTVGEWCEKWFAGYAGNKQSTVKQARTHIKRIEAQFGRKKLRTIKPSDVNEWTAALRQEGLADSTIYALHSRFSSIMGAAQHDGLITRNPCSRRTAPRMGRQRPYVATTAQVWALHEAMPGLYKNAVLLGAFAGLRIAEAVALRPQDVDREARTINPRIQYPHDTLKTDASRWPIPVPATLINVLDSSVENVRDPEAYVLNEWQRGASPDRTGHHFTIAKKAVPGLPDEFRFHDLRHYFASQLIGAGLDILAVQHAVRHEKPSTTLNVYGHLLSDKNESARAAIETLMTGPGGPFAD